MPIYLFLVVWLSCFWPLTMEYFVTTLNQAIIRTTLNCSFKNSVPLFHSSDQPDTDHFSNNLELPWASNHPDLYQVIKYQVPACSGDCSEPSHSNSRCPLSQCQVVVAGGTLEGRSTFASSAISPLFFFFFFF